MTLRPEVQRALEQEEREKRNEEATRLVSEHRHAVQGPRPTIDALRLLIERARRRLPPESWQRMAEREAARLGMEIQWEFYDHEEEQRRRAWAVVVTARGKTIVAPQPFQTWQTAFAEVGINPGEAT